MIRPSDRRLAVELIHEVNQNGARLARAPNQVWIWDITWLKGLVRGIYYRLYLIIDLFSRKIVGWDIWEKE